MNWPMPPIVVDLRDRFQPGREWLGAADMEDALRLASVARSCGSWAFAALPSRGQRS